MDNIRIESNKRGSEAGGKRGEGTMTATSGIRKRREQTELDIGADQTTGCDFRPGVVRHEYRHIVAKSGKI